MVFCIAGIVIFAILGIFSGKYRGYFRASMHCLKRHVMLKPCDTTFDQQMKAKIAAKISKSSPRAARFVLRRFMLLSWIFLILMVFSIAGIVLGFYNFTIYGNCNGPNSNEFCIFNVGGSVHDLKPVGPDDDPTIGDLTAPVRIIEVGCFSCPYTKDAETVRGQLVEKYGENVSFTFRSMPLPEHELSWEAAEAANCALEQDKYWEYHDMIFEHQSELSVERLKEFAVELNLDADQFDDCFDNHKYKEEVEKDFDDARNAGIFATPTFYVNGQAVVGLKAFAELENIVVGEISGSCGV